MTFTNLLSGMAAVCVHGISCTDDRLNRRNSCWNFCADTKKLTDADTKSTAADKKLTAADMQMTD